MSAVVHRCPAPGQSVTPCCGLTPWELPRTDRIAVEGDMVTCWTADDPRIRTRPDERGPES